MSFKEKIKIGEAQDFTEHEDGSIGIKEREKLIVALIQYTLVGRKSFGIWGNISGRDVSRVM